MSKILYVTTYAANDPTKATLPFILSVGALAAGHNPQIALLAEAPLLTKDSIAEQINGVGFPPLVELWSKLIDHEVPIYVLGHCSVARGVTDEDLQGKKATFASAQDFDELVAAADKVVSF